MQFDKDIKNLIALKSSPLIADDVKQSLERVIPIVVKENGLFKEDKKRRSYKNLISKYL